MRRAAAQMQVGVETVDSGGQHDVESDPLQPAGPLTRVLSERMLGSSAEVDADMTGIQIVSEPVQSRVTGLPTSTPTDVPRDRIQGADPKTLTSGDYLPERTQGDSVEAINARPNTLPGRTSGEPSPPGSNDLRRLMGEA